MVYRAIVEKLVGPTEYRDMDASDSASFSSDTEEEKQPKRTRAKKRVRLSSCHLVPYKLHDEKSKVSALIDYNVLQDKANIQDKIDYFFTPYNKKITVEKFMQFDDLRESEYAPGSLAQRDWKIISNFILNNDKKEFR